MQEFLPSTLTTEDTSDWIQPVEGDLGCPPPSLDPQLKDFLGGETHLLAEQKGEMVFSRNQCLNPPSITALNRSHGELTRSTPQPGGQKLSMVPRERDLE